MLPLLESDLLEVMMACTNGTLENTPVKFSDGAACCVIMASGGYPKAYKNGYPITVSDGMTADIYFAGAKDENGALVTAGGRVLGVTAVEKDLGSAIAKAYENVTKVNFEGAHFRKDIGKRAMAASALK